MEWEEDIVLVHQVMLHPKEGDVLQGVDWDDICIYFRDGHWRRKSGEVLKWADVFAALADPTFDPETQLAKYSNSLREDDWRVIEHTSD